jgi:hypothetical protein
MHALCVCVVSASGKKTCNDKEYAFEVSWKCRKINYSDIIISTFTAEIYFQVASSNIRYGEGVTREIGMVTLNSNNNNNNNNNVSSRIINTLNVAPLFVILLYF